MSNHITDTSKKVSDTPRTDKVTRTYGDVTVEWEEELVPVEACRAIERELNAANERIKRLEEELFECNTHRERLIVSAMEAWGRIDEQEGSR